MREAFQDMNIEWNQNRSLKPSNRARFKENIGIIFKFGSEPSQQNLPFKKVFRKIELRKKMDKINKYGLKR